MQLNAIDGKYLAKRICIGLIAMFGASVVIDLIPNPFVGSISPDRLSNFILLPGAWSTLETVLAALVGAYFARVPFAAAAALFITAASLVAIRILQSIAETVQPVGYSELLGRNSLGMAVAILGAAIGAEIGLRLVQRKAESWPGCD